MFFFRIRLLRQQVYKYGVMYCDECVYDALAYETFLCKQRKKEMRKGQRKNRKKNDENLELLL